MNYLGDWLLPHEFLSNSRPFPVPHSQGLGWQWLLSTKAQLQCSDVKRLTTASGFLSAVLETGTQQPDSPLDSVGVLGSPRSLALKLLSRIYLFYFIGWAGYQSKIALGGFH